MSFTFRRAVSITLWTTALVVSASASAQSETCADGGGMWSSAAANATPTTVASLAREVSTLPEVTVVLVRDVPVAPADVQWCVDPSDPRCSPDPAGAPSGHLRHAGELAQATVATSVPDSPMRRVRTPVAFRAPNSSEHVRSLERPPHAA